MNGGIIVSKLKKGIISSLCITGLIGGGLTVQAISQEPVGKYSMPLEEEKHEGTWLQWPHNYTYGKGYKENIQDIWVKMTKSLTTGENVHVIAYNQKEEKEIQKLLVNAGVNMKNVDFYQYPTDDVWVRDNGPVFAYDKKDELVILDWGFNGWGKKEPYKKSDVIPQRISKDLGFKLVNLNEVVLEGGAIEFDGSGTSLATRSSVTNNNRNAHLSEKEIEDYLYDVYGITNPIWLDGVKGEDITDFHIDGFARFLDEESIVTLKNTDLIEWGVKKSDRNTLLNAKNTKNKRYNYEYLPLTKQNVRLKNGQSLGYKGSYLNYYVANSVVLVPNYNDPNDKVANETLQKLYPNRKVVGIDVRQLYKDGGMIHCVTQQQPIE